MILTGAFRLVSTMVVPVAVRIATSILSGLFFQFIPSPTFEAANIQVLFGICSSAILRFNKTVLKYLQSRAQSSQNDTETKRKIKKKTTQDIILYTYLLFVLELSYFPQSPNGKIKVNIFNCTCTSVINLFVAILTSAFKRTF